MQYKITKFNFVSVRKTSLSRLCWLVALWVGLTFSIGVWPAAAALDYVAQAELWFNKIETISANFTQVASDGTSAEGKLLFRRPSRMKITYGDGGDLQLITSKIWLHVDRPNEKLLTSYPLSETPLSLILAPKVLLRLDGYETRVMPSSSGIVQIMIARDEGEAAGELILEFSEKPFQFRRWTIVDAVGVETSVTLQNLVFDKPIPNAAFALPNYFSQD